MTGKVTHNPRIVSKRGINKDKEYDDDKLINWLTIYKTIKMPIFHIPAFRLRISRQNKSPIVILE